VHRRPAPQRDCGGVNLQCKHEKDRLDSSNYVLQSELNDWCIGHWRQKRSGLTTIPSYSFPRRCPCPDSALRSAAGWPAAGGLACIIMHLAPAKKPVAFIRTAPLSFILSKLKLETVCGLFSWKKNQNQCVWVEGPCSV